MKTLLWNLLAGLALGILPSLASAQVNSGSNGSDGALNPAANLVINMADHPTGIYQYTSVNIPVGITVTFIPNASNKPVVWLLQGDCIIGGTINISGTPSSDGLGTPGGPGGYTGGNGGSAPSAGGGPGGGLAGISGIVYASEASYGTLGSTSYGSGAGQAPGQVYGNTFILPLIGGSGGAGSLYGPGGAGGGGAILIVTSGQIQLTGTINAGGGRGYYNGYAGGCGSGGAVRLVATKIIGTGSIATNGSVTGSQNQASSGSGRVRFDTYQNNFGGSVTGVFTQGFQPIILPTAGQGIQLGIGSIAGAAVPANPAGVLANPDIIIPAQQNNPIPIVVNCTNIPLNTEITVVVHPANGADVQAVGINNAGTTAASTATVSLNMPRGGGIIYAKAVTGITGTSSITSPADAKTRSIAETGWTADGERFIKMEITAALGSRQQITYITESGKRYPAPAL